MTAKNVSATFISFFFFSFKHLLLSRSDDILSQMFLLGESDPLFTKYVDYTLGVCADPPSLWESSRTKTSSLITANFTNIIPSWSVWGRMTDLPLQEPAMDIKPEPTFTTMCWCHLPPWSQSKPIRSLELEPNAISVPRPQPISRSSLESALWNQFTQEPAEDCWFIDLSMELAPTLVPAHENTSCMYTDHLGSSLHHCHHILHGRPFLPGSFHHSLLHSSSYNHHLGLFHHHHL